ncbi:MAG: MBL fold metallo-hydrolase [Firmicutes bacterium]|nr:MBL fold metallo-hydrolase [Bacillota bacterium]
MKITYHGHACFTVESGGYSIVLDPYKGVRGYSDVDLTANEVLCSHGHFDHAYTDGVKILKGPESPFEIKKIDCFHDNEGGAKRGTNIIHVLSAEGKRVAHFGDLGHMLSEQQAEQLKDLDCIMIPVCGFFTIDAPAAVEVIRKIEPKMIIPMHYKDGDKGLEMVGTVEQFIDLLAEDEKKKLLLVKGYEETAEI